MPGTPRPIAIDTDPGVDDALALMLALRSPDLQVELITTVAGNVFTANRKGGVVMRDVHGSSITGNTFKIIAERAVSVDSKSSAITISGNTFADRSVQLGLEGDALRLERRRIDVGKIVTDGIDTHRVALNASETHEH